MHQTLLVAASALSVAGCCGDPAAGTAAAGEVHCVGPRDEWHEMNWGSRRPPAEQAAGWLRRRRPDAG